MKTEYYARELVKRKPVNRFGKLGYIPTREYVKTKNIGKHNYRKKIKFSKISKKDFEEEYKILRKSKYDDIKEKDLRDNQKDRW